MLISLLSILYFFIVIVTLFFVAIIVIISSFLYSGHDHVNSIILRGNLTILICFGHGYLY